MAQRITTRQLSVTALVASAAAALVGCQQAVSQSRYAPPSFDAPRLAVAAEPTVPAPVLPTPPVAVIPFKLPPPRAAVPGPLALGNIPRAWVPPVRPRPWRWIIIHHSDTAVGDAAYIDKLHKARGWDGLGYDFVIGNGTLTADGQVEVGYRWTEQGIGAHAKTLDNRFNEYGIGICLVGNMMEHPPTAKQMAAVERLSAYLMDAYHIAPDHILGHGQTKPTECPGRYTNLTLIRAVASREAGGSPAYAAARPAGEMLVRVDRPR